MAAILDSLKVEHEKFRRYLDLIEAEVTKYEEGESPDYELVDLLIEYFTSFPDELHHLKENHVYDALAARSDDVGLYDLRAEHERLEAGVRRFAERVDMLRAGGDVPSAALLGDARRYAELLRSHMVREDEEFLPRAERRLAAEDWIAISSAVERELATAGGAKLIDKLASLERRIEEAADAS